MSYGLTKNGLVIKTLDIVQKEIDDSLKAVFGKYINTLPQSVFGQLKGIFAEREALLWELIEDVYNSQYPDSSEGLSLDNVGSITAFSRLPATRSIILRQALFGTPTTIVPAGTIFTVENNPLARFLTNSDVTIGLGEDEIQKILASLIPDAGSFKIVYNVDTTALISHNATITDIQNALNALPSLSEVVVTGSWAAGFTITFQGADGKKEHPKLVIQDNTLTSSSVAVTFTITVETDGEFQAIVSMNAENSGPTVANAGTLNNISTPISGLVSTYNINDASVGRNRESDAEFKVRRNDRLQISLAGPTEAIRSAILRLNDIIGTIQIESVIIFENITNVIDARGLPPKSFEAFIYQVGGATDRDQEIADTIYLRAKPAGIEPIGSIVIQVQDSQGFVHDSKFSRPDEVDIYLILDLTVNSFYPTDGDDLVKDTIVAWGNKLGVGADVIVYPALIAQLYAIPGIVDVGIKIGKAPAPISDSNIVIDDGTGGDVEISRWSTARITVNS